jgi:hypothetical protein
VTWIVKPAVAWRAWLDSGPG